MGEWETKGLARPARPHDRKTARPQDNVYSASRILTNKYAINRCWKMPVTGNVFVNPEEKAKLLKNSEQ